MGATAQNGWKPEPGWSTGEEETINAVLRRAAKQWGDRPFVDIGGEVYSFGYLNDEACRLANGLRGLGVEKGQTVVTLLDNNIEAICIWLAITKLGAISVPVNTAYKGEFLRHQIADAGAAVVLAESDFAERIGLIADRLPEVKTVVYKGEKPNLSIPQTLLSWASVRSDDASDPEVEVAPGDLAMLIYTGGTTGPSKGCMCSHNYVCNLARQCARSLRRSEKSITWTPLPLFHLNAYTATILSNMMLGARIAFYPRFSVSNFWPEIERTGANDCVLLANMMPLIVSAPENEAEKRCYGQLETVGGAPFPYQIMGAWKKRFGAKHTLQVGFGLSECSLVTSLEPDDPSKPNASGKRNDTFDVRIVDDNDVELPPGTPGEIIVRPLKPHVMFEGYWRRPEDTLKVMKNMWFHTGDIGMFDEDGYFYFVDRKKDYLRRGGENISSFEMETTFRAHPGIQDVAVHAVKSELSEDEVKVTAILHEAGSMTEEDLCHWVIERVPYFAVPRFIEFRKELPRSPVGRILKYELRDQGITPATWDRQKSGIVLAKR
ncbi:MAG: AMP-binding protein [Rhodocyclaceae bacterium]|jgi:crotonobetaine/carnitine-CoA ligase|nr:AMP-binding protein [Rhodocyclaceae bacterium]